MSIRMVSARCENSPLTSERPSFSFRDRGCERNASSPSRSAEDRATRSRPRPVAPMATALSGCASAGGTNNKPKALDAHPRILGDDEGKAQRASRRRLQAVERVGRTEFSTASGHTNLRRNVEDGVTPVEQLGARRAGCCFLLPALSRRIVCCYVCCILMIQHHLCYPTIQLASRQQGICSRPHTHEPSTSSKFEE